MDKEQLNELMTKIDGHLNNQPIETVVNVGLTILVKSILCYREKRGTIFALLEMASMCELLKENVFVHLDHESHAN